ncbi:unnamed protein product [Brassicogethes aeneus]|uniref:WAP domain-containing protein n=1 Tax=Brassicogethes aeneus TaxID=1431903 RepID=A0A9P0AU87_BRAAE|nr:unnamed protein product [Brassicogethes aeneus]
MMRVKTFWILCFVFLSVTCQDNKTKTVSKKNAIKEISTKKSVSTPKSILKEVNTNLIIKDEKINKAPKLICPGKNYPKPFFSLPCSKTKNCSFMGKGLLCCGGRCLKGVPPPKEEIKHEPIIFGLVDRKCPSSPIPEIFTITKCEKDSECLPRICCPEKLKSGEIVGFCRTAEAIWDRMPLANQFMEPFKTMVSYMQCTPPPPPILDVFPKPCENALDCFPNLCCQEGGKKFCRPPKRSILSLMAGIGQRLVPTDAARAFIKRIS